MAEPVEAKRHDTLGGRRWQFAEGQGQAHLPAASKALLTARVWGILFFQRAGFSLNAPNMDATCNGALTQTIT